MMESTEPTRRAHGTGRTAPWGVILVLAAACASTAGGPPAGTPSSGATVDRAAPADGPRGAYSDADAAFMRGMIHHHAQALVMSRMAPSHGASDRLLTLTARIVNSQTDEIHLMQRWLRDRGERVPQVAASGEMASDEPMMHMPGMLSDAQMAELDAARGFDFDHLFLTYMIQHHRGALTMVDELFATWGAGQEEAVFKLASDIGADQATEIERMQKMLRRMVFETPDSP